MGGDQVFFLRSKGGIKRFFQIKKGDHLYFLKKENILINISEHKWNSCQFYRKGALMNLSHVATLQNEVKS